MLIVIEYVLDTPGGVQGGRLVTVFIQNGRLKVDDIETLTNLCQETHPWGWDLVTVTNYIAIAQVGCKTLYTKSKKDNLFYILPDISLNSLVAQKYFDHIDPVSGVKIFNSISRYGDLADAEISEILANPVTPQQADKD